MVVTVLMLVAQADVAIEVEVMVPVVTEVSVLSLHEFCDCIIA